MSETASNNKRIAKNTLLLYFRMLLVMGVTFYTSRVVLATLGVVDFGIYNVAGGVIGMFAFINSAMTSATQRYITFELGKGDSGQLQKVFSTSLQIHAAISLIIILLGETLGLWFLLQKLVIPAERMSAAIWVYQCSILVAVVNIMSVPYNATIVAHERISAFAYISVLEVGLKLLIVFLLVISSFDKLVVYAVLLLLVQLLIRFIYGFYCKRHFAEATYHHFIDRSLLKEMSGFAGWSFFGNLAGVLYSQGLNMMLNIFFGPVVNAARGVAVQVQTAVLQFVGNFQMALNPQITKTYAAGQLQEMHKLMFRSARFSFFLLFFLALPVLLETNFILSLWLKVVPENTVVFLRIMLCTSLIYTFANPMFTANAATGKVKTYQMVCGSILLAILPISYIALRLGAPAYSVFIVHFCVELTCQLARMYMLKDLIGLPVSAYFKNIYFPVAIVVLVAAIVPSLVHLNMEEGWLRFLAVGCVSVISVSAVVLSLGLSETERTSVLSKVKSKLPF